MEFEVQYTVKRRFEVPENATDEEYDALRDTVIDGIAGSSKNIDGTVKAKRIDTPAKEPPKYDINKDCD